jgi:hypothetical protein
MFNSTLKALLLVFMILPSFVWAGESLLPVIPKANAEQCVGPTQDMRVHHMDYILHQRDETMHKGVRTKKHSLKECINCHVVAKDDGSYPSVKTNEHFCATCHKFAAVSIDCFQCHSDKPEIAANKSADITSKSEVTAHGQ